MTDTETARKGKLLEDYAKAVSDEIRSSLRDAVKLRLESTSAAKIHHPLQQVFDFWALSCATCVSSDHIAQDQA